MSIEDQYTTTKNVVFVRRKIMANGGLRLQISRYKQPNYEPYYSEEFQNDRIADALATERHLRAKEKVNP